MLLRTSVSRQCSELQAVCVCERESVCIYGGVKGTELLITCVSPEFDKLYVCMCVCVRERVCERLCVGMRE